MIHLFKTGQHNILYELLESYSDHKKVKDTCETIDRVVKEKGLKGYHRFLWKD